MSDYQVMWNSKLFYGKYLYKLKIHLPGISYIRYKPSHKQMLKKYVEANPKGCHFMRAWERTAVDGYWYNFKTICNLYKQLQKLDDNSHHIRINEPNIGLYFTNELIALLYLNEFEDIITEYHKPKNKEVINFLKNSTKHQIAVHKLPHNICRYRCHVKSRDMTRMPLARKKNFKQWIDLVNEEQPTIITTASLQKFLDEDMWACGSTYFYVRDKEHLAFCYMHLGDIIKSMDEFILFNGDENV